MSKFILDFTVDSKISCLLDFELTARNIPEFILDFTVGSKFSCLRDFVLTPRTQSLENMFRYVTELTHEEEWSDIPLCFKKPDWKHVSAALIGRDWPDARGIWLNDSENFFVLINEEEHMK